MSHYLISADPSTPNLGASATNKRARRRGYILVHDRHANCWSLYDRRLRLPIAGLDRTTLAEIKPKYASVQSADKDLKRLPGADFAPPTRPLATTRAVPAPARATSRRDRVR